MKSGVVEKERGVELGPGGLQCKTVIMMQTLNIPHFTYVLGLVYTISSRMMRRSIVEERKRKWGVLKKALDL